MQRQSCVTGSKKLQGGSVASSTDSKGLEAMASMARSVLAFLKRRRSALIAILSMLHAARLSSFGSVCGLHHPASGPYIRGNTGKLVALAPSIAAASSPIRKAALVSRFTSGSLTLLDIESSPIRALID